jgi:hypothetical protein
MLQIITKKGFLGMYLWSVSKYYQGIHMQNLEFNTITSLLMVCGLSFGAKSHQNLI